MARVSDPQRTKRPNLAQVTDPLVRRRLGLFATLLVACFVTSWLPLPYSLATIVFAGWALVIGIMTLRHVRRAKTGGVVVPLLVVGIFSAVMLVVSTGTVLLVWPVQQAWQECRAGAVTVEAVERCDRQQRQDLEAHLRGIMGLSSRTGGTGAD